MLRYLFAVVLLSTVAAIVYAAPGDPICTASAMNCSQRCVVFWQKEKFQVTPYPGSPSPGGAPDVIPVTGACGFYYDWNAFGCPTYIGPAPQSRTSGVCNPPSCPL